MLVHSNMNKDRKQLANKIENIICDLIRILIKDCRIRVNSTNGVDLTLELQEIILRFEVKSAYRWMKRGISSFRNGRFYFKANELKQDFDGYLFVEKINRKKNLAFFERLNLFFISKTEILRYFNQYNLNIKTVTKININCIKRLNKLTFSEYCNKLEEGFNLD